MRGLNAVCSTVVACVLVCACGHDQAATTDAGGDSSDGSSLPASCWPDDGQIPMGSAMLGTGVDAFQPMPAMLPIEYGSQDGFDLIANVKMEGLIPGNPHDVFDPTNPRTRIRAYFADTGTPLNAHSICPWRIAYVPSGDGSSYTLPMGVAVIFDICWRSGNLIGQRVVVALELVDAKGDYARSSETVTLAAPTGFYPMEPPAICPVCNGRSCDLARNENAAFRLD